MKKGFFIFLILLVTFNISAQKKNTEKVKDTVKTEVVEVITKYNPKISDATKIKINPVIQLSDKTKKKKLGYTIYINFCIR